MDRQRRGAGARPLDPELAEARELLALRRGRVNSRAARRQPVDLPLANSAEVARAEEHQHLVFVARLVQRVVNPNAGEADVAQLLRIQLVAAVVEHCGVELDPLGHATRIERVDSHRFLKAAAGVEEHQLEWQLLGAPQRAVGAEADVAVSVVVEVAQLGRELGRRGFVGCGREIAGARCHVFEIEGPGDEG